MGHMAPSLAVVFSGLGRSLGVSIIHVLYFFSISDGLSIFYYFLIGSKNR